jgi:hypothetical protein
MFGGLIAPLALERAAVYPSGTDRSNLWACTFKAGHLINLPYGVAKFKGQWRIRRVFLVFGLCIELNKNKYIWEPSWKYKHGPTNFYYSRYLLTEVVISVYIGSERAVNEVPESTRALNLVPNDLLPTVTPVTLML